MGNFNQGKVNFREKTSTPITSKGKDKMVLFLKSKSGPQLQGVGYGSLNLEKRKVGEKVLESSYYDSLSSSDLGTLRGECSTRNRERQCGLEEEITKVIETGVAIGAIKKRQPRKKNVQEEEASMIVDLEGNNLIWC
ncbi:hypothetical protein QYF36_009740 [Acer negundo]|nr:hypothetical protein QYF36_009740 [Acer negundo]